MAHLSLYRQFRPDSFDKLVRQEHVVRILQNQLAANAVGHAYLFTGPRGTGKTTVARIFARAVNCEHPVNGSPCGVCPVCRKLQEGSLDIVEIDAASNNGVAEMRELREKVQYPPVSGRYKVYIIDEVHMLTDSAFNALLKTLEEPPAHVIFILATTEPQKIPATILSRCMRLDFKLIPEEDLEAHLKSVLHEIGKEYEEEAISAIARAGAGSDRDMLSIAEACIVYSEKLTYAAVCAVLGSADFRATLRLVKCMLTSDAQGALDGCESVLGEGKSAGVLCKDIMTALSRVTVAKTCRNAEKLLSLPKDLYAAVKEVADAADGKTILRAEEIFIRTESELRFVSSPRIALETAIMRVSVPESDYDLEALLVRVNRLEAELSALKAAGPVGAPAPQTQKEPAPAAPQPQKEAPPADESFDFPTEEPVFDEAYFSDEAAPAERPAREPVPQPARAPAESPAKEPVPQPAKEPAERPAREPAPSNSAGNIPSELTAEAAYGRFVRILRRRAQNGVLFMMCSELEAVYEGSTLVLYTDSETISRSLARQEHRNAMAAAFAEVGISDFEVRYKKAGVSGPSAIEALKRDFKDYPIEIKD